MDILKKAKIIVYKGTMKFNKAMELKAPKGFNKLVLKETKTLVDVMYYQL